MHRLFRKAGEVTTTLGSSDQLGGSSKQIGPDDLRLRLLAFARDLGMPYRADGGPAAERNVLPIWGEL